MTHYIRHCHISCTFLDNPKMPDIVKFILGGGEDVFFHTYEEPGNKS